MPFDEVTIGNCRLIHGDCREVLPLLPPVDLVLTDPPYGITYQSNSGVGSGTQPITNDGTRVSLRLYRAVIPMLRGAPTLWCTRWDAWPDVWELFAASMKVNGLLVWDKGTPGMGDLNHWGPSYELIASCGPVKTRGSRDCSVLRYNTVPSNKRNHPTEKPVGLFEYLTLKATDGGATVLDPFMGSGTTGVAAVKTGRAFIGVEADRDYFETACRRIEEACSQPKLFEDADGGDVAVQVELLPANGGSVGPPEARSAVGNRQAQLDGGPSRTKGSASHHG